MKQKNASIDMITEQKLNHRDLNAIHLTPFPHSNFVGIFRSMLQIEQFS